jgi:hypothetical protein
MIIDKKCHMKFANVPGQDSSIKASWLQIAGCLTSHAVRGDRGSSVSVALVRYSVTK